MTRRAITVALLAVFVILAGCAMPVVQNDPVYSRQPGQETTVQARARIRTELSAGYYTRGQFDVALEELNGALKDDPGYAPAYGMLGLVYSELRDDAQAERHFQRAIELNPQDPEVRNNYGWFLCQRGREPQSLGQFELAIRNPFYRTPDLAMVNAGRCAAKIGDRKGAEAYFQQALTVSPANPAAHYFLTDLAYKAGDLELARTRMRGIMASAAPSPEGLLLGVCIERKLGNKPDEASYLYQLRQRYPNAKEVKLIDSGGCQ
jgi:type IV pilus assembly protein PilF